MSVCIYIIYIYVGKSFSLELHGANVQKTTIALLYFANSGDVNHPRACIAPSQSRAIKRHKSLLRRCWGHDDDAWPPSLTRRWSAQGCSLARTTICPHKTMHDLTVCWIEKGPTCLTDLPFGQDNVFDFCPEIRIDVIVNAERVIPLNFYLPSLKKASRRWAAPLHRGRHVFDDLHEMTFVTWNSHEPPTIHVNKTFAVGAFNQFANLVFEIQIAN